MIVIFIASTLWKFKKISDSQFYVKSILAFLEAETSPFYEF